MSWWFSRHSDVTFERCVAAFPSRLAADVRAALEALPKGEHEPTGGEGSIELRVSGEPVRIPYRVYFPQPPARKLEALSRPQRRVVAALLTRHHDGHVRERWVEELLASPESWVPAFVVPLLGEYVIEIARAVQLRVSRRDETYEAFAKENPAFCLKTCARMINYWALYYRQSTPRFSDYPGYQAAMTVGIWRLRPPRDRHAR
jgi:hypothetical protein